MKYLVLIFVFTVSFQLNAQTKPFDSFMGIKWGSSASSVLKKMAPKENVEVVFKTDTLILLKGGTFGARDVFSWRFYFWNNQLYSVILYLSVPTPILLDDLYYDLKKDLTKKYGYPFSDDSTSYSDRKVMWRPNNYNKRKDECYIIFAINSDPFFWLVLAYQNEYIFDKKLKYELQEREKALKEL
jgi:hypothetical protein